MLTRLRVKGFKNLVDVDVYFGPFTCVAGANGVGKSNLFDAIRFLSALADRPLIDAALSVRDEGGRTTDVHSLFHRVGNHYDSQMSFEVEMIVPAEAIDDLGQVAKASITSLKYALVLAYRTDESSRSLGSLEIIKEELSHITKGDASRHLLFPHKVRIWRDSVVKGERRTPHFISTKGDGLNRVILRHQDGGSSGRPLSLAAANLPRTVLSAANAAESPTALVARREMQSWRLLQLEPSALRKPDEFVAPSHLGLDGSHLAATLYHLANSSDGYNLNGKERTEAESRVYAQVANRLSSLIDDVHEVWVDRDEKRQLLTLQVTDRSGTSYAARELSDGTLRFLALSVLDLERDQQGLICLEEPENGIHPGRVPAMLELLQDIATDTSEEVGLNNPLRQVIVNTHSPLVVSEVPEDSLLVAELKDVSRDGKRFTEVAFRSLPGTWRQKALTANRPIALGQLRYYLNPTVQFGQTAEYSTKHRVVDREDLQIMLPGMGALLK
jgi:predicted ATPase